MDHAQGSSVASAAPSSHQYPDMMPPNVGPNLFANYPLKGISHPHPHDVLCGRGGQSNSHAGNAQWRMLVAANKELYVSLPKKQKMLLAQSIVNAVRSQNPPGRFLQKDVNGNSLWYDVGDKRAQEKTSQALREGAPEIRTKLHPTTISPNPGAAVQSSSYVPNESEQSVADSESSSVNPDSATASTYHQPKLAPVTSSASIGSSSTQPTRNYPPPPQHTYSSSNSYYHGPPYVGPHPPLDYVATMAPPTAILPSIPAQGPVPERKSHSSKKKERQNPKESNNEKDNINGSLEEIDEIYVPDYKESELNGHDSYDPIPVTSKNLKSDIAVTFGGVSKSNQFGENNSHRKFIVSLDNFDDAPIEAPPRLDGNEFSFGSVYMTDAEQARLMTGCSFGTTMSYGYTDYHNDQGTSKSIAGSSIISNSRKQEFDENPPPVDGGLEPVGLSFGSVMSIGTAVMENVKLEGAGFSFGSVMSITRDSSGVGAGTSRYVPDAVDGGLQEIGTSFGSLTLGVGERERIIESAKHDLLNNLDDSDNCEDATALPRFKQTKSKGSLLECSDTDSEDDEASNQQLTAQKSAKWEKMQAVLASTSSRDALNAQGSYNYSHAPYFSSSQSRQYSSNNNRAPSTLNIPTASFARDQSQMSAISVNDDFPSDFDHHVHPQRSPLSYSKYLQQSDDHSSSRQQYQQRSIQYQHDSSWFDQQNYSYQEPHHFRPQQYIIPAPVDTYYNGKNHHDTGDNGLNGMMPPPTAPRTTDGWRQKGDDKGEHGDTNQRWISDFDNNYVSKGNSLSGSFL